MRFIQFSISSTLEIIINYALTVKSFYTQLVSSIYLFKSCGQGRTWTTKRPWCFPNWGYLHVGHNLMLDKPNIISFSDSIRFIHTLHFLQQHTKYLLLKPQRLQHTSSLSVRTFLTPRGRYRLVSKILKFLSITAFSHV